MWSYTLTSPASFTATAAADLRTFLRLNTTSEDATLTDLLAAAEDFFRLDTGGHVLCSSAWTLNLDGFPSKGLVSNGYWPLYDDLVPYPYTAAVLYVAANPVTSIDSVQYFDVSGNWQTLVLNTDYRVDITSYPARVLLTTFPVLNPYAKPTIRINFHAGYTTGNSPKGAQLAVKLLAAHWYNNGMGSGSAFVDKALNCLPYGWEGIINKYKIGTLGEWHE